MENAGWGAGAAAPIARRAFDYMLLGQYPSEEDMAAVQKGLAGAPIGKPRRAAEMTAFLPGGTGQALPSSPKLTVPTTAAKTTEIMRVASKRIEPAATAPSR